MRTGEVEANLVTLNGEFRLPYISDLVARKPAGPEKSKLEDADIAFHEPSFCSGASAERRQSSKPLPAALSRDAATPRLMVSMGDNKAVEAFHESEYQRLRGELQSAHDASQLPEQPGEQIRAALNDLLVRIRLSAGENPQTRRAG